MNKFSTKSAQGAQGGFTLIELIVVIVILGILAATALPKFASLSGDARIASLQAAKGAMSASASMVHGRYLIKPATTVGVEGTTVNITNGYPTADASFAAAAGISGDDYKIDTSTAGTIKLVPKGIEGSALETTCFVTYTQAASGAAPTYGQTTSKCE